MQKSSSIIAVLFSLVYTSYGQALLTVGNQTVTKQEFLHAFNKNSSPGKASEQAIREYLDLYIKYKLKVKAAYDLKLDQQNNQVAELSDFRNQIIEAYLNDQRIFQQLIKEAVERTKKDIRVAHIYIPIDYEKKDTLKAWKMAGDAYKELQRGTDFGNVASLYSADTSVRSNKGDIGYITAFTLPYPLESEIYNLSVGKVSKPLRTTAGYHLFKNLGERKAVGTIKAAQILLVFPPDVDDAGKRSLQQQADSIYNALLKGASFNELAIKYNTDRVTTATNGEMQEFGVGRYEPAFENAVFALNTPGEISKPIVTAHGYHIVKLIQKIPVLADTSTTALTDAVKAKLELDARMQLAKQALTKKIFTITGIKNGPANEKLLLIYGDSILQQKSLPVLAGLTSKSVVFTLPKQKIYVSDWGKYINDTRNMTTLAAGRSVEQLFKLYKEKVASEYYKNHLEEYNEDFAIQLREFKEGNMLFEVMQLKVWDKAAADSSGLKQYYASHRNKYVWGPSADVIMFNINDTTVVKSFREKFLKNPADWKSITASFEGRVQADSGRYELTQLPGENPSSYKAGVLTDIISNSSEGTATLIYIVKTYTEKGTREFEDAKGLVLNDYQQVLEEKWLEELKKKYPVKINESTLKTLWQ